MGEWKIAHTLDQQNPGPFKASAAFLLSESLLFQKASLIGRSMGGLSRPGILSTSGPHSAAWWLKLKDSAASREVLLASLPCSSSA